MNSRSIQAVLRSLAKSGSPQSDAELLRRFVSERDERAFTALVHRHGRLVWAVCRHLTRCDADADDAFQATFVVLIRNAAKIRDASRLSVWLHGAAYKICAKSRQSTKRRVTREQASAERHQNGWVVADSAWDRALASVHDEVARLPEKLRTPFVLCCLEGRSVTDAANEMGCKVSALSARLVRAKNALQIRLEGRGVTLGVAVATVAVTAGSAGGVPAAVLARTSRWLRAGDTIPDSILQLSQGVMTMSMGKTKLVAAGLIVACGLGLGGVRWLASVAAQEGRPVQTASADKAEQPIQPRQVGQSSQDQGRSVDRVVGQTARWEYDFVLAKDVGASQLIGFIRQSESRGWEFIGQVTLLHDGNPASHWAFRRPHGDANSLAELTAQNLKSWTQPDNLIPEGLAHAPGRKEIEAEIKRLQERLTRLDEAETRKPQVIHVDMSKTNPDTLSKLVEVVQKQADQKFGASQLRLTYVGSSGSIFLQGAPQEVKWAAAAINMLCGNAAQTLRPPSPDTGAKR